MIYKENPLGSQYSTFGCESIESLLACLINLLPKSFGVLSLCLSCSTTFLGACLGFGGGVSPPCHWFRAPGLLGGLPLPGTTRLVDLRERSFSPGEPRRWVSVTQRNTERLGDHLGSPAHQTRKNLGSNLGLPYKAEGESDQLPANTP
jgi:hypothetical protein